MDENMSINTFPGELSKGRLKTIHKSGDNDIDNHRSIIVPLSLSKIYEKLLLEQFKVYLNQNGIIHHNQYGF